MILEVNMPPGRGSSHLIITGGLEKWTLLDVTQLGQDNDPYCIWKNWGV